MDVEQLSPHLGVEVTGIDFTRLTESEIVDLAPTFRDLWDQHQLIVIRGQELEPEDQIRFVRMFGTVADERHDGTFFGSNTNTRHGGPELPKLEWHYDYGYSPYPHAGIALYGEEVTGAVAATGFASSTVAYTRLPAQLRERLESLTCLNAGTPAGTAIPDLSQVWDPIVDGTYDGVLTRLPAVGHHPRTGLPMLQMCGQHTVGFDGLSWEAGRALLDEVYDVMYGSDVVVEHEWSPGDLVYWDNFVAHHGRGPVPRASTGAGVRTLRRVVMTEHLDDLLDYCPGLRRTLTAYLSEGAPAAG